MGAVISMDINSDSFLKTAPALNEKESLYLSL